MTYFRKKSLTLLALFAVVCMSSSLVHAVDTESAADKIADVEEKVDAIKEAVVEKAKDVKEAVEKVDEIKNAVDEAIDEKLEDLKEAVDEKVKIGVVRDAINDVIDTVDEKADDIAEAIDDKIDDIKEAVGEKLGDIVEKVQEAEAIADAVKDKIEDARDALAEAKGVAATIKRKLSAVPKEDAKKLAVYGLGAWGAATGIGWVLQKFGETEE